jgi:4-aminobutyrate aminotransferase-like enzyme
MLSDTIITKYRRIVTEIPHPDFKSVQDRLAAVESRSMHGQLPVFWDRAEGCSVFDPWGNQWIDFTSTIFVANVGHGNDKVVEAIASTARKPLLHAYNYATTERLAYLEALISATPTYLEKAFLVSAGTEAVEAAIKLMRLRAVELGKRRGIVIALEGNWHGRTMGAQQLSSNVDQRAWVGYDDPNVLRIPFPYSTFPGVLESPELFMRESLTRELSNYDANVKDDVAGFILETYQGWGAFFYPPGYVAEVERVCRESSAVLCFDEMQSGFGRTGKFFGYEHYGVEPDLVCCGKGASSSLPLAFVLGRAHLLDLPAVGSMSSTHSANPVTCAAGLANLRVIQEEGLVERSARMGAILHEKLKHLQQTSDVILSVEGRGLVAALIFAGKGDRTGAEIATEIAFECMRKGLLVVHTGRESIKVAPPLTIPEDALHEGLEVLGHAVRSLEKNGPR